MTFHQKKAKQRAGSPRSQGIITQLLARAPRVLSSGLAVPILIGFDTINHVKYQNIWTPKTFPTRNGENAMNVI